MRGGQPEEAGKAQRPDRRVDGLQRAAEHLRPDINAERRLQRDRRRSRVAGRRPQSFVQTPLHPALAGVLHDRVDHLIAIGGYRLGIADQGRTPVRADTLAISIKQRLVPQQADRQKTGDRVIAFTPQLGLPQPMPGIVRPTAQRDEQPMEIAIRRTGGQPHKRRRPRDRLGRRAG